MKVKTAYCKSSCQPYPSSMQNFTEEMRNQHKIGNFILGFYFPVNKIITFVEHHQ